MRHQRLGRHADKRRREAVEQHEAGQQIDVVLRDRTKPVARIAAELTQLPTMYQPRPFQTVSTIGAHSTLNVWGRMLRGDHRAERGLADIALRPDVDDRRGDERGGRPERQEQDEVQKRRGRPSRGVAHNSRNVLHRAYHCAMRTLFVRSLVIAFVAFAVLFGAEFFLEWDRAGRPGWDAVSWAGVNNAKLVDIAVADGARLQQRAGDADRHDRSRDPADGEHAHAEADRDLPQRPHQPVGVVVRRARRGARAVGRLHHRSRSSRRCGRSGSRCSSRWPAGRC